MKDELLFICELLIKVFSNPSNETNNNNVPLDKYIRLPKRVMKKIGSTQAFEKSFGFHVPYNQIDAYIKLWEKHVFFRPFFKQLYDLQYLRYDTKLDKVGFNRSWMTKFEFYSSIIISLICSLAIIHILIITNKIAEMDFNLTRQLFCYLGIYCIAFIIVMAKVVIPHLNAIRFIQRH